jgi:hypothetical protein
VFADYRVLVRPDGDGSKALNSPIWRQGGIVALANGSRSTTQGKVSLDHLDPLLRFTLRLPRFWLAAVGIVTMLSVFDVTRAADGGVVAAFRLTTVTPILIALVWLPVLVKQIVLTGGGIKTSFGEASTGGLLDLLKASDPGTQRAILPPLIAALDVGSTNAPTHEQPRYNQLRSVLETQLAAVPAPTPNEERVQSQLQAYAQEYENLRRTLPSGIERTTRMETLVNRIMVLARQVNPTPQQIGPDFEQESDGNRVVALAIVRANPSPVSFDIVMDAISHSRSAFEQYQALVAADRMHARMSPDQQRDLVIALRDQRSNGPGKMITDSDPSRWNLSGSILKELEASIGRGNGKIVSTSP